MNEREWFVILGIDPVRDEDAIKQAYRRKLVDVNPEDDPDGFKKLRQAYEKALEYAQRQEEEAVMGADTSPVGLWLEKAGDLYECLPSRLEADNWKKLFSEDVFLDLDTAGECRERLLKFLMDNFRLPAEVWQVLDRALSIREERKELYETYPRDFVDYAVHQCEGGEWFPFRLFRGDERAQYDLFISRFFEIGRQMENQDDRGVKQLFEEVDALGIYHPYMELERARYLELQDRRDEADRLIDRIMEELGEEDARGCYMAAEVKWKNGKRGEAAHFYQKLLEKNSSHYLANKMVSRYYLEIGEYEKAKEYCIEAVKTGHDPELDEQLTQINSHLTDGFRKRIEQDPGDMKARLELGWCYLQDEEYLKGISLLSDLEPDDNHLAEYHNLMGKLYYSKDMYDKSLEHIRIWMECLKDPDPDEKEEAERSRRLATGHTMLSQIYREYAKEDKSWYEKALDEIRQAAALQKDDAGSSIQQCYIYMDMERYQDCVDVCTEVLKKDSAYFPALVLRQEAYSKLRDAQGVINDYYGAKEIYAGYPKIYELAAEVYYDLHRYEDLDEVLKAALENQVESSVLDLYRGRAMRMRAESAQEGREALDYLLSLESRFLERKAEGQVMGELYCEISICSDNLRETKEALEWIDKALLADGSCVRYDWIKAGLLEESEDYSAALKLYKKHRDLWESGDSYHYHLGECYYHLRKYEEALEQYKKTLEQNPEHDRANSRMVDIYTTWLEDRENIEYLSPAILHADRQLELNGCAYYYIERGLLYMAGNVWDKALADFLKAEELEPDNLYAHNNAGCVYKYTGDYGNAEREYQEAVRIMEAGGEGENSLLPYGNLGDTYERMGRLEEAYECYMKNLRRFPKSTYNYCSIAELLRRMGRYDEALGYYRKLCEEGGNYLEEQGDVFFEAGKAVEALSTYRQAVLANEISIALCNMKCGRVNFYLKKNMLLAGICFRQAVKAARVKSWEYREIMTEAAGYYYFKGNRKKAALYANLCLKDYEEVYGDLERYLNSLYYQSYSYFRIGVLHYYKGDYEAAGRYFSRMKGVRRCRKCTHTKCIERLAGQGLLCELAGDREGAAGCYRELLTEDSNVAMAAYRLRQLER